MVCKKCGKKVKGEPEVCPRCGAPMQETVSLGAIHAAQEAKHKKKLTKKQLAIRITLITVASLLAVVLVAVTIMWAMIAGNVQKGSELESDIGINSDLPTEGVQNIALFGLDTRKDNEVGHSDAMIIVSIDRTHNKVKMTSLARDSLVEIDGHDRSKLTHAFGWGGVNLAVKTINQNFGMNIRDYAYVNFFEFAKIIDYVGGVNIDVSESEMRVMNKHYVSWIQSYGINCPRITKTGMQRLNGGQALAYARNRYSGTDLDRGDRQKEVLQAMFDEVKNLPLTKFPGLITKILGMCHTNMTSGELMSIATWALTSGPEFVNNTLPSPECKAWGGNHRPHGWVWIYDLDYATAVLHDFIYETDKAAGMSCTKYGGHDGGGRPVDNTTAAPHTKHPAGTTTTTGTQPAATTGSGTTTSTGTGSGSVTATVSPTADPTVTPPTSSATSAPTAAPTAPPDGGESTDQVPSPAGPQADG